MVVRQLELFVTRWHGPYLASIPDAPCHLCGRAIRSGERVYYADHCLDGAYRTCAGCRAAA